MERTTDTIAAVATPAGPGAIGILRLSGPEAVSAASAAFRAADGRPLEAHPPRRLIYGDLLDREGAVIDKVLATYTRGPASYTGEDTAELHCHGAPMVLSLGLESLFSHGARQAGPGEFTRRAFLNGRLDLVQADIDMFEPLSQLYSLKPETDEEIAEKERLMEEALENASAVPLQIMEKCGRAIELSVAFAKRGSRIAVSDAGSSAILCKAALQAASLNVYINTRMMQNRARAEELNEICAIRMMKYTSLADEVFECVSNQLKKGND